MYAFILSVMKYKGIFFFFFSMYNQENEFRSINSVRHVMKYVYAQNHLTTCLFIGVNISKHE